LNFYTDSSGTAYQPGYFFADRRSAILGSTRIGAVGCSSRILSSSYRSVEPLYPARFYISTSCAKQAYEKVIPASLLACLKQFLMSFCINFLLFTSVHITTEMPVKISKLFSASSPQQSRKPLNLKGSDMYLKKNKPGGYGFEFLFL